MFANIKCINQLLLAGLLMSLASIVAAQVLSPQWQATSEDDELQATIYPKDKSYVIGEYHQWVIEIKNTSGQPQTNLQISISGGMAAHKHGLPSQPSVTQYLGRGKYLIEGVLFNMQGDWTLLFFVQNNNISQKIHFDLNLRF